MVLQEVGVAEDEVKYGAAARLAKLDGDLLDVQQDMATCLEARQAALARDREPAQTQLARSQVIRDAAKEYHLQHVDED